MSQLGGEVLHGSIAMWGFVSSFFTSTLPEVLVRQAGVSASFPAQRYLKVQPATVQLWLSKAAPLGEQNDNPHQGVLRWWGPETQGGLG